MNIQSTLPPIIDTQSNPPICVGFEGSVSVNPDGESDYTVVWNNVQPTDVVNGNEMTVFPQNYSNTYSGVIIDNCNLQETAFQIPLEIFQIFEKNQITK